MTQTLNAKGKPFSWSFSAVKDFENCRLKYAGSRFYCNVPYKQHESAIWGDRVHKAGEMKIKGQGPIDPEAFKPVEKYVTAMMASGHKVEAELAVTLTSDFKPTTWFAKDAWLRIKIDVVITKDGTHAIIYDWKGLSLDTTIPTPSGWTNIKDIREGDKLFASNGSVCTVVGKSQIFNRKCYKIVFRDGASVVCDDQHLWLSRICVGKQAPKVRSATEIFDVIASGRGIAIPVADSAKYTAKRLSVHPYVLGCWLGDGSSKTGEITKPNRRLFHEIIKCGYWVGPDIGGKNRCTTRTIYGLRTELRKLNLLHNKHIPEKYLRSSHNQRLALLQGLFDTDGTWNFTRGQAVFCTNDGVFAGQVVELLASLGQKPYKVKLKKFGFGKHVMAYDVIFTPRNLNPFRAHRKAPDVLTHKRRGNKSSQRYIKAITEIPSVPTQCIAVDSKDNTYLCTDRYVVTHNTGKVREDPDQIRLAAAVLSIIRPQYETFNGKFIWTAHDLVTGITPITKAEIPDIWADFLPRVERMQQAWDRDHFPPRPSGLCPWCQVNNCPQRQGEMRR